MGLAKIITTRTLGFLSGGLGLALAATAGFAFVQTERLGAAQDKIETRDERIGQLVSSIQSRDTLIARQNDAVRQLQAQNEADRAAYLERLAAADKRAKVYQGQAARLLKATTEATDELGRCRAAVQLIQDTLAEEQ